MKFILVLMLLLMIIDCKKLRNKYPYCKEKGDICYGLKGECCDDLTCIFPKVRNFKYGLCWLKSNN